MDQSSSSVGIEAPEGFAGEFLTPVSPGYEQARRIENMRVMRTPTAIARCTGVPDVQAALALARDQHLPVAVRSGGHSAAGWSSTDGLVIDLTAMRGVEVDPASRTAWVQGGALAGDIIDAAYAHGLAAVTGISRGVGLGGLLLGIGEGYLTARHGFGVDNVEELELVTADGDVLQVTEVSHPDLFFALRGAGANFGVVTRMKLRLHPVPESTLGGTVSFGPGAERAAIDHVWDLMRSASIDSWPSAAFFRGEDGLPRVNVTLGHVGDRAEGEEALSRLRSVATPISDTTGWRSYLDLVDYGGAVGEHTLRPRAVWNLYRFDLDDPDEPQKQLILDQQLLMRPSPATYISVWRTPRVASDAAAAAAPRHPGINVFIRSMWDDPAEDDLHVSWMEATTRAFLDSGLVTAAANTINHISELKGDRLRDVYGEETYQRLSALKATYDPRNVFSGNANIPPRRSDAAPPGRRG